MWTSSAAYARLAMSSVSTRAKGMALRDGTSAICRSSSSLISVDVHWMRSASPQSASAADTSGAMSMSRCGKMEYSRSSRISDSRCCCRNTTIICTLDSASPRRKWTLPAPRMEPWRSTIFHHWCGSPLKDRCNASSTELKASGLASWFERGVTSPLSSRSSLSLSSFSSSLASSRKRTCRSGIVTLKVWACACCSCCRWRMSFRRRFSSKLFRAPALETADLGFGSAAPPSSSAMPRSARRFSASSEPSCPSSTGGVGSASPMLGTGMPWFSRRRCTLRCVARCSQGMPPCPRGFFIST
mmetsp:Transcript_14177/g.42415  ORF Transcript_14177/g.42415 Transcript_14177/m.42415 type:complete len:300 (-) Transcript_14177:88-987(-)